MATKALVFADAQQTQELHPVFTKVYGMTVIERTLHALDRAGTEEVILIAGENEATLKELLATKKPENISVVFKKTALNDFDF